MFLDNYNNMLHIVPISCLILFVGLVEYRLKKHLDETDERIDRLEKVTAAIGLLSCAKLKEIIEEKQKDENSSNE